MYQLRKTLTTLALTGLANLGHAASVHVVFDNPIFNGSGYDAVWIQFEAGGPGGKPVKEYVAAGRFQGTGSNPQGVDPLIFVDGLDDLYMYCYDVYESINHGSVVDYNINFGGELARTRQFLGAVNAVMNPGKQFGDIGYDKFAWLHPVNRNQGAAIQLGIWESRYEAAAAWDLQNGSFAAWALEADTTNYWNSFRNAITSSNPLADEYVMTLEAAGVQDMITGDPPVRVPEPGTLLLAGLALAAAAATRRRHGAWARPARA